MVRKGGKREGAGSPFTSIPVDKDTARIMRILALNRKSLGTHGTPRQIAGQMFKEWAQQAWREYDAEIQRAAEIMGDAI